MATTAGRLPTNLAEAFAAEALSQVEKAYFADLGYMVAAYARAEAGVHVLARYLSGMPEVKARAIFGGMRLPDLTDLVRQMMRINETSDDIFQEVDACLVQLGAIANQRNKLVHRMVHTGPHISVSNALTAKSLAAIEAEVFSQRDLRNMQLDCGAIFVRLLWVIEPDAHVHDAEVDAVLRAPWRYIPPQRASGRKQGRPRS